MRIFAAFAVIALPACQLETVDADVSNACITYTGVEVPAVPPSPATGAPRSSTQERVEVDQLGAFADLVNQGFELTLTSGEVVATSGIADFSFVTSAAIAIAGSDGEPPPIAAFGCDPCDGAGSALELAAGSADIAPYIATGAVALTVELAGPPPSVAWTMDVQVCASAWTDQAYSP